MFEKLVGLVGVTVGGLADLDHERRYAAALAVRPRGLWMSDQAHVITLNYDTFVEATVDALTYNYIANHGPASKLQLEPRLIRLDPIRDVLPARQQDQAAHPHRATTARVQGPMRATVRALPLVTHTDLPPPANDDGEVPSAATARITPPEGRAAPTASTGWPPRALRPDWRAGAAEGLGGAASIIRATVPAACRQTAAPSAWNATLATGAPAPAPPPAPLRACRRGRGQDRPPPARPRPRADSSRWADATGPSRSASTNGPFSVRRPLSTG